MPKVIVNPLNHILYSSFYIYALQSVFGVGQVVFDVRPFKELPASILTDRGLLFTIQDKDSAAKRFYIDGNDSYKINEEIYNWCDVYASVNANFHETPGRTKLVSLAPSFAIRPWGTFDTICAALSHSIPYLQECGGKKIKTFLGNYKRLLDRPFYKDMNPGESQPNYVFFCSTLWYSDEWNKNDEGVNARRANFIRACKQTEGLLFEGGFVAQEGRSSAGLFNDCLTPSSYPYRTWLQKTKQSAFVFNTPAFWNCHGWKLGEYLALGKAIISTPLSNDLPAPLVHGKNIHFVENNTDSIKEAINLIISNPEYRIQLERGAKHYWNTYGTPEKSIGLIIHRTSN